MHEQQKQNQQDKEVCFCSPFELNLPMNLKLI